MHQQAKLGAFQEVGGTSGRQTKRECREPRMVYGLAGLTSHVPHKQHMGLCLYVPLSFSYPHA
jgi:hypothetical protein